MLIYFILLAAAAVSGFFLCRYKWGEAVYCIVFAIAFTVISAARSLVGWDYYVYGTTYVNLLTFDIDYVIREKMEKGFLMPLYFLSLGFENYKTIFVYTSVILYPVIFAFIYKYSGSPWISVCSFLCSGTFFVSLCFVRQMFAALVVTYAIKFINDKNPSRYMVIVLCASVFHWSALIMIPLYILLKIKPSGIYLGIVTAGMAAFYAFSRDILLFVIDKFSIYQEYNPDTNAEVVSGISPIYTIMIGVPFIVCFLFRKRLMEKNPRNGIYLNCLMYNVIFEAMGMRHGILSRFSLMVCLPPMLYLIPDAVKVIAEYAEEKKGKVLKYLLSTASAAYAIAIYITLVMVNYNGVVPYESVFSKDYDLLFIPVDPYNDRNYDTEEDDGYGEYEVSDIPNEYSSEIP